MSRSVEVLAPAKVNLTLEVLGRRPDRYHELCGLFATIGLTDRIRVAPSSRMDVRIVPPLPEAEGDDLAVRALRVLAEATGREPRAAVRVRKRIPLAAGLGGGSSDAASVLHALAALWRVPAVDLVALAARIGSDVPFFAARVPFAVVSGRGELVRPLTAPPASLWLTLVALRRRLSTAAVFGSLGPGECGDGQATQELANAFDRGAADAAAIRRCARNDLLAAAERCAPEIADVRALAAARGIDLQLSGSGPSLFAVADDRADALRIARALRRLGLRARPLALGFAAGPTSVLLPAADRALSP
ncbi:MAG: 4-(cytidine 5'-diphospho)-2-C-methyl-D-erythritol kinase [Chloroflexota bacterium]|nr:4-(cytidine 5'-diphospho)-2-C-methyl-D-erythritol kinase [Chloroflexota bacterium]